MAGDKIKHPEKKSGREYFGLRFSFNLQRAVAKLYPFVYPSTIRTFLCRKPRSLVAHPSPPRQDDYPHPLLFLWQGTPPQGSRLMVGGPSLLTGQRSPAISGNGTFSSSQTPGRLMGRLLAAAFWARDTLLMIEQRCHGRAWPEAVLLPPHDHDPRRPHREAPQVRNTPPCRRHAYSSAKG